MSRGDSCISTVALHLYVSACVQLNIIPVMFCCSPGAVGWCSGDVAVCKAGLTNVSLAGLRGPFAVLQIQTTTMTETLVFFWECVKRNPSDKLTLMMLKTFCLFNIMRSKAFPLRVRVLLLLKPVILTFCLDLFH